MLIELDFILFLGPIFTTTQCPLCVLNNGIFCAKEGIDMNIIFAAIEDDHSLASSLVC